MTNEHEKCTISITLKVLGGKWKIIILWHLIQRTRRFSELEHIIPGITHKMLTQHLRELEMDDLIHREVYPEVPPRVEYSLTAYGKTLIPILNEMAKWGLEHEQSLAKNFPSESSEAASSKAIESVSSQNAG
jgi:DNA-binding HxlR family transcriptional regulator